jgi:hypothetical protein
VRYDRGGSQKQQKAWVEQKKKKGACD